MNTKQIVFKNIDGSCGIVVPASKALETMTIEQIAIKDVPKGLPYRIIDVALKPKDRVFRDAWTDDNPTDTIDIDMPKARGVHMGRIRAVRDNKLKALDTLYLRALEASDEPERARIASLKQVLRDIPATYDLSVANSPEELKIMMPEELI